MAAARRPSRARDRFVAVSGAVVLFLVALGLAVVADRGAPSEHAVVAEGVAVTSAGELAVVREGTMLEGGACVPPGTCTTRTEVAWRLSGLPPAPDGTAYEAVLLRDASGPEPLGPFGRRGDLHVLHARLDGDASDAAALRLVLASAGASGGAGAWTLHEVPLDGPTGLGGSFRAAPEGGGSLRLEQVGAVSVSLLANADLRPAPPGGVLRGWLQAGSGGDARFEYLGEFAVGGDGAGLDVRRERVVRAEQDRFLVTLESGPPGARPAGFPAFAADL